MTRGSSNRPRRVHDSDRNRVSSTSRSDKPKGWPRPRQSARSVPVAPAMTTPLAETVNGLHKAELINRQLPWRSVDQVELATAE